MRAAELVISRPPTLSDLMRQAERAEVPELNLIVKADVQGSLGALSDALLKLPQEEVRVNIDAEGQPGYLTTARMLGEAGLLMAGTGLTPDRSGCLTPATALGTESLDRFERARVRFSVAA